MSERITPSADSKFDPSFQVFFCDDVEELNEAYFRDFTVNHYCIQYVMVSLIYFSQDSIHQLGYRRLPSLVHGCTHIVK